MKGNDLHRRYSFEHVGHRRVFENLEGKEDVKMKRRSFLTFLLIATMFFSLVGFSCKKNYKHTVNVTIHSNIDTSKTGYFGPFSFEGYSNYNTSGVGYKHVEPVHYTEGKYLAAKYQIKGEYPAEVTTIYWKVELMAPYDKILDTKSGSVTVGKKNSTYNVSVTFNVPEDEQESYSVPRRGFYPMHRPPR